MSTVTGDFAIDFSGLSNQNPYSNPVLLPQYASEARIDSGVFRSVNSSTGCVFRLDPAAYVPGSVITSKVEVADVGGFDGQTCGVVDDSGNGYRVYISDDRLRRHRIDAWAPDNDTGATYLATISDGDTVEVEYNKGTGVLVVRHNGDPAESIGMVDGTHADKSLAPHFGQDPSNDGAGGIISFAADGVTAAGGGSATKLSFSAQPGNAAVGQTMSAVQVSAVDDDNELDTGFDGDVTIALQTGTGTLSGTLTKAAVAGVATFDDLSINAVNTGAVLRATSSGLTQSDSAPFNITALTAHIREQLIDKNGDAVANETGITMVVYHAVPTEAAPNPSEVIEGVSTDANGDIDEEIAIGSLEEDDPVWIALVKDGTPPQGTFKKVVPVYE